MVCLQNIRLIRESTYEYKHLEKTHTLYLKSGNSLGTVAYHLFNILVMDNHTNDIYKVSMVMVNKPLCFVKRYNMKT